MKAALVARPMTDEAGARFALVNAPFRAGMQELAERHLRNFPDDPPERFHVVRILLGYYELAAMTDIAKDWARA